VNAKSCAARGKQQEIELEGRDVEQINERLKERMANDDVLRKTHDDEIRER
jgi:hypothetical protein